jgi:hypothetical protein
MATTATAYEIIQWAKDQGEVKATDRIRVKVLLVGLENSVFWDDITQDTDVPAPYLNALLEAVEDVVGRPFPH